MKFIQTENDRSGRRVLVFSIRVGYAFHCPQCVPSCTSKFLLPRPNVYRIITVANGDASVVADAGAANATLASALG